MNEEQPSSPKNSSDAKMEVRRKAFRLSVNRKNKRKCLEPRRLNLETTEFKRRRLNSTGSEERSPQNVSLSRTPSPPVAPAPSSQEASRASMQHLAPKKRFKLDAMKELERLKEKEEEELRAKQESESTEETISVPNPFRPWNECLVASPPQPPPVGLACIPFLLQGLRPDIPILPGLKGSPILLPGLHPAASLLLPQPPVQEEPLSLVKEKKPQPDSDCDKKKPFHIEKLIESPNKTGGVKVPSAKSVTAESEEGPEVCDDKSKQRNYKNLTRERRVEANARERQRVHTITAAFDTLQAAIPTEEENIKLSKLSVIKIATAYIMALSRMAGYDYTEDRSAPSVESVINHCRQTISTESKLKHRKS